MCRRYRSRPVRTPVRSRSNTSTCMPAFREPLGQGTSRRIPPPTTTAPPRPSLASPLRSKRCVASSLRLADRPGRRRCATVRSRDGAAVQQADPKARGKRSATRPWNSCEKSGSRRVEHGRRRGKGRSRRNHDLPLVALEGRRCCGSTVRCRLARHPLPSSRRRAYWADLRRNCLSVSPA